MKKKLSEAVKNKTIGDIELFEELGVTTDLEIEEHEEFVDWVKDFKVVKKEIKEDFKNIKEDLNMYLTTSEYWKRQAQFYEKQGEKDVATARVQGYHEGSLDRLSKNFDMVASTLDKIEERMSLLPDTTKFDELKKDLNTKFLWTWIASGAVFLGTLILVGILYYNMYTIHPKDTIENTKTAGQTVERVIEIVK